MRSSGHKQELFAANMGWQNDERIRCVLVLSTLALKYGRARIPGNTGRAKVIAAHRQLQTLIGANEADRRALDKAMADYAATWQCFVDQVRAHDHNGKTSHQHKRRWQHQHVHHHHHHYQRFFTVTITITVQVILLLVRVLRFDCL